MTIEIIVRVKEENAEQAFTGSHPSVVWRDATAYADLFYSYALSKEQCEEAAVERGQTVRPHLPSRLGVSPDDPDYMEKLHLWADMYDAWRSKWARVARKNYKTSSANGAESRHSGTWYIDVERPND